MKAIAVLSTVAALAASAVCAQDNMPGSGKFTNEGSVGPWKIFGDTERGTCLMEGVGANGNVVQMGLTKKGGVGYVGVFTQADIGAHQGAEKPMTIVVNDKVYTGEAHEMKRELLDGYQGGYVLVNNPEFVDDMKKGFALVAWPDSNNGAGVVVDLKDSYKAIEATIACNKKVGAM